MKLETERLLLRIPKRKDVLDLVEGLNNLKISEFLGFIPHPYTKEDAEKWIKKDSVRQKEGKYELVIELKSKKKIVGGVLLGPVDEFHESAKIGYWINENYWKRGIATEAVHRLIDFAFNELNLRRLHLGAYVENISSQRVAEKLGFKLEGVLRQSNKTLATGKIHDTNTYGLLREEVLKSPKIK